MTETNPIAPDTANDPTRRQQALTAQDRDLAFRRTLDITKAVFEIVKACAVAGAAIAVFLLLQRPESALNRTVSSETISRERAKLMLDVLHEQDPFVRALSLEIIGTAYPQGDDGRWILRAKDVLKLRDRFDIFQQRSAELIALVGQINQQAAGAPSLQSPEHHDLLAQATQSSKEMQAIADEFKRLRVDLPLSYRQRPHGAITLDPTGITATEAMLHGVPLGITTDEWFEIGPSKEMGWSVNATGGAGRAQHLKANTMYWFRYVTQDTGMTCFGETKSFKLDNR